MTTSGEDIVNYLLQFKGTPYVWGGSQPGGFDCSGLMQYGFAHFGINLNRTTYDQIGQGQAINIKGLRPGDLVFFDTDKGTSGPDHVGIYMGDGKMFHTPRPGKSAEIVDMTSGYYMDRFMGGRRIAGVQSTGAKVGDYETDATAPPVKMTPEELAANYGFAYAFLKSQPGVDKIFDQAVKETWTPDRFQAAIRDSDWWKKNSDTARQTQVMEKTDPATYQATLAATKTQVRVLASKVGAAIPESQMTGIAKTVMASGADENSIRQILGNYVTFTKDGTLAGEAGMHAFTMKQYSSAMGIDISDQALKNQAALVVKKLNTTQDFEDQIRNQSKSAYPGYADQIDAGMTMRQIADPYMQTMAQELELPATSLGLKDPTIKSALNGVDAKGKPAGKNLLDFTQQLRNDPRWAKTANAQNSTMAAGLKVLQDLGLAGNGGH